MSLIPDVNNLDILQKRVRDSTCARCRRPILPGHRIQAAWICINNKARNPNRVTERGLELGIDAEFCHVECRDPYLTGKLARELAAT